MKTFRVVAHAHAVILLWSVTAQCAPGANELAAYKDAGARLGVLIASAQDARDRQQLKTPEVMSLVRTISDEERILGTGAYSMAELDTLMEICEVANKAVVSLALFDLKSQLDPKGTPEQTQAAAIPLMTRNIVAFQDELKEIQPFLFRCLARQIPPMTQFIASLKPAEFTDIRRQGLRGARSGLMKVYFGAIRAGTESGIRDDYRNAVLTSLAETADAFASIVEVPARRKMQEAMLEAAAKATGEQKLYLTRIATAFGGEQCDGLCAIH
jgi:hypothetical protein